MLSRRVTGRAMRPRRDSRGNEVSGAGDPLESYDGHLGTEWPEWARWVYHLASIVQSNLVFVAAARGARFCSLARRLRFLLDQTQHSGRVQSSAEQDDA